MSAVLSNYPTSALGGASLRGSYHRSDDGTGHDGHPARSTETSFTTPGSHATPGGQRPQIPSSFHPAHGWTIESQPPPSFGSSDTNGGLSSNDGISYGTNPFRRTTSSRGVHGIRRTVQYHSNPHQSSQDLIGGLTNGSNAPPPGAIIFVSHGAASSTFESEAGPRQYGGHPPPSMVQGTAQEYYDQANTDLPLGDAQSTSYGNQVPPGQAIYAPYISRQQPLMSDPSVAVTSTPSLQTLRRGAPNVHEHEFVYIGAGGQEIPKPTSPGHVPPALEGWEDQGISNPDVQSEFSDTEDEIGVDTSASSAYHGGKVDGHAFPAELVVDLEAQVPATHFTGAQTSQASVHGLMNRAPYNVEERVPMASWDDDSHTGGAYGSVDGSGSQVALEPEFQTSQTRRDNGYLHERALEPSNVVGEDQSDALTRQASEELASRLIGEKTLTAEGRESLVKTIGNLVRSHSKLSKQKRSLEYKVSQYYVLSEKKSHLIRTLTDDKEASALGTNSCERKIKHLGERVASLEAQKQVDDVMHEQLAKTSEGLRDELFRIHHYQAVGETNHSIESYIDPPRRSLHPSRSGSQSYSHRRSPRDFAHGVASSLAARDTIAPSPHSKFRIAEEPDSDDDSDGATSVLGTEPGEPASATVGGSRRTSVFTAKRNPPPPRSVRASRMRASNI